MSNESPAKRAQAKYASLVSDVQNALGSVHSDIAMSYSQIVQKIGSYYGANAGDSSSGSFATVFEAALVRCSGHAEAFFGPWGAFTQAAKDLEAILHELRSRKFLLDRMCREEDEGQPEYLPSEIPWGEGWD